MSHQSPTDDQVRPNQGTDQGTAKSGEQQHQVIRAEGRNNTFQHHRHRVPKHIARGRKVENRAGVPIGVI
jgi:hypothetical protein